MIEFIKEKPHRGNAPSIVFDMLGDELEIEANDGNTFGEYGPENVRIYLNQEEIIKLIHYLQVQVRA